ncbi:hypothetical protein KE513_00230 [Oscillospiraceae bacterium Marseille-Q3528]|nr:hypothetical protein [Oscillospiraceae bacterium Marseille-Q3528]
MTIKPILFNTEMVRAILDGRKTCTRRIVKTRRKDACGFYVTKSPDGSFTGVYEYDEDERMFENPLFPPYKPGDILYVRETWDWDPDNEVAKPYYYKADGDLRPEGYKGMGWSPSIHMPKEAARIWLRVTNVRVERLQDITDNEAEAEGFTDYTSTALGFAYTWDHTIKKSDFDRYGWAANPWVWVIQFERCEKPER